MSYCHFFFVILKEVCLSQGFLSFFDVLCVTLMIMLHLCCSFPFFAYSTKTKNTKQHPIAVSQSKKPICFISQPSTTFLHTQLAFYWGTSSPMTSKSRRYVDLDSAFKTETVNTELSFLHTVDETCHLILSCSHFPFSTNDTFKSRERERYCCSMKTLCSFF